MTLSEEQITKLLEEIGPGGLETAAGKLVAVRKIAEIFRPVPPVALPETADEDDEDIDDEIYERLLDLQLPAHCHSRLSAVLSKAGYTVGSDAAEGQYDLRPRTFVVAMRPDELKLALVHVPKEVYRKPSKFGALAEAVENIDGFVRFLSPEYSETHPRFTDFLNRAATRGKRWGFTPWTWIERLLKGRDTIELAFALPRLGTISAKRLEDLTAADRQAIEKLLAGEAASNVSVSPSAMLRDWAGAAGWPEELRKDTARISDDPDQGAREVVSIAIQKARFDNLSPRFGDTYLGVFLQARLEELGGEKRDQVAKLILHYNLVSRPDSIKAVRAFLPKA